MPYHAGYSSTMILLKPGTKIFIETYSQWLETFSKEVIFLYPLILSALHFKVKWFSVHGLQLKWWLKQMLSGINCKTYIRQQEINEKILKINEFYSLYQAQIYFCCFLLVSLYTRSNVFCICQIERNKPTKYRCSYCNRSQTLNNVKWISISSKIDESVKQ